MHFRLECSGNCTPTLEHPVPVMSKYQTHYSCAVQRIHRYGYLSAGRGPPSAGDREVQPSSHDDDPNPSRMSFPTVPHTAE